MGIFKIKIVDAFTKRPFSGNPAGVVLEGKGLTDGQMKLIARELNASETAFILPAAVKEADIQIRWFSPLSEVSLCGHATIASFHSLAEEGLEGMSTNGQHYFKLQTKSGILPVRVEKNFYETTVELELPLPKFKINRNLPVTLCRALGLKVKDIDKDMPIVLDKYLYLPVGSLKIVEGLDPEFQLLKKELAKRKLMGACVFSLETKEKCSAVHSRFFSPNYGINEDPVTGSSNGPLGCYLYKYVISKRRSIPYRELSDGRLEFIGEQGDEIKRKGRVKIRVRVLDKEVDNIAVAGEAVTILNTEIKV